MPALRIRQRGLSLVELLVATALSGFLILGVSQMFLDHRRNYLFQQGQLANQENARLAARFIEQLAVRAGYRARPEAQGREEAFPALAARNGCPAFAAGETLKLVESGARASLCVRYQRGLEAQEADCEGNPLAFSNEPLNVLARLSLDRASGRIGCASIVEGGVADSAGSSVLDGLLDFSVQPLPGKSAKVQALSIALLFASEHGQRAGVVSDVPRHWRALTGRNPALGVKDSRLFHISQASVALRSLSL